MISYFVILFITVIIGFVTEKFKAYKPAYNFFIFFNATVLILFAGLRNASVGTDTNGYVSSFLGNEPVFSNLINNVSSIEIGYRIVEILAAKLSGNYYSILVFIATIFIYLIIKGIYKISVTPSISIFIFLTFGLYTFVFNGARQGIALAFFIYAIQFVVNKQFVKYALFIGIGFLFHKTIIVTLPFYFLFRLKFNIKLFTFIVLSTFLIILFFNNILNIGLLISDKYIIYTETSAKGGQMLTIAYIIFGVFFIIIKPLLNKSCKKYYDIYLNMYLIGPVIFIVIQFTGAYIEITRLAIYFLSAVIFIWPLILKNIDPKIKPMIFLFFLISNLTFFYIFINKIGNLIPYKFNNILITSF
jgi:hypothetical protein